MITLTTILKAPRQFLASVYKLKSIFTFSQERLNRFARYFKIVKAYKAGKPIKDIEQEYGCSRTTVLRYARLAGLEKRPKRKFKEDTRQGVINRLRQGESYLSIEKALSVSQAYISGVAKQEGLQRYKR